MLSFSLYPRDRRVVSSPPTQPTHSPHQSPVPFGPVSLRPPCWIQKGLFSLQSHLYVACRPSVPRSCPDSPLCRFVRFVRFVSFVRFVRFIRLITFVTFIPFHSLSCSFSFCSFCDFRSFRSFRLGPARVLRSVTHALLIALERAGMIALSLPITTPTHRGTRISCRLGSVDQGKLTSKGASAQYVAETSARRLAGRSHGHHFLHRPCNRVAAASETRARQRDARQPVSVLGAVDVADKCKTGLAFYKRLG